MGRSAEEVGAALAELEAWLAGKGELPTDLAGPGGAGAGPASQGAARRHPAAVPDAAGGDRGGAMSVETQAAEATSALLESGAIMLGTALVFVTLFRKLEAGRDAGLHRRRRADRAASAGPGRRTPRTWPASPRSASRCCCSSSGSSFSRSRLWRLRKDIFGLGLAQVVLCGLALSLFIHLALGVTPGGGAGDRPAARPVVDRPGAADAARRTMSSTRRRASGPSRSCCSRTWRSCR